MWQHIPSRQERDTSSGKFQKLNFSRISHKATQLVAPDIGDQQIRCYLSQAGLCNSHHVIIWQDFIILCNAIRRYAVDQFKKLQNNNNTRLAKVLYKIEMVGASPLAVTQRYIHTYTYTYTYAFAEKSNFFFFQTHGVTARLDIYVRFVVTVFFPRLRPSRAGRAADVMRTKPHESCDFCCLWETSLHEIYYTNPHRVSHTIFAADLELLRLLNGLVVSDQLEPSL